MKTPRALLAALLALSASVARAGDPTIIFLPQSNNSGVADFSRPQNGADWKILRIERNEAELPIIRLAPAGTRTSEPITLVNPYDEYFIIPAANVMGFGATTVLSVSKDPYPGAMRGEPVRLVGPTGQPTGPQLWLPSRRSEDIRDQLNFWPIPADNTRVDRPRIILPRDRFSPDNTLQPPSWFTLPGQRPRDVLSPLLGGSGSSSLFTLPGQSAAPPTYYTAVTNYRYDARKKKLIGPDGREKSVSMMNMPAGSFFLAPPALPADFRIPGLTFVNTRGETVDTRRGAQPPASDGRREFKKPSWAGNWKDKITHIHKWHAVETAQAPIPMAPTPAMTFYCYHEQEDGHSNVSGHLKSTYDIVECVDWVVPPTDEVQKAEGKEFRIRHNRVVIDVVYKDKALRRVDTGGPNIVLKDKPLSHAAIGGQNYVKVTAVPPPAQAPAASLALLDPDETRWLTKEQAGNYPLARKAAKDDAAIKAVDARYRALVEEQTRPEAKAPYAAAHALPIAQAPAKISEAVGKVEMWGGAVKAVVGLFQEKPDAKLLEIQLSKEQYAALEKKPEALAAYKAGRQLTGANKTDETATFNAEFLDPVQLRLTVVAALKAIETAPAAPAPPAGPEGGALLDLLTDEDLAFLTPVQRDQYKAILDAAPEPKKSDRSVQDRLKILRPIIESRRSNPYPKDGLTEATFDAAPTWQKDIFCTPARLGGAVANSGPTRSETVLNEGGDVVENLSGANRQMQAERRAAAQAAAAPSALPAWAVAKCKGSPFYTEPAGSSGPREESSGIGNIGGGSGVTTGPDAVGKPVEEGSKWFTKPLVQTSLQGAAIGLLIGSLFGPVGLIAGPLLGAAVFYGMKRYDEIKAEKAKIKPE